MKNRTIKVADASGLRRRAERFAIEKKEDFKLGEIVNVEFTDEYIRNGCERRCARKYVVDSCGFENDYKAQRAIRKIWLSRVYNAGQRPVAVSCASALPAGGARDSASNNQEGELCAK